MKRKIFIIGTLFFLLYSLTFAQKITNLAPDTLPPADLAIENTPQFIFIGSDDQMNTGGFEAVLDMVKNYKNPQGKGKKETRDGEPVRFSFYSNTQYQNPYWMELHQRAFDEGHELGLHTKTHPFIGSSYQAINELSQNLSEMTLKYYGYWDNNLNKWIETCDTIFDKLIFTGVRSPYLYVSDYVFDALDELNLRYDCSIEEGMSEGITSPNGFVWPYTADGGATPGWRYLADTVGTIPNTLTSHPGKWVIPAYPLFWIPDSLRTQYGITRADYDKYKNDNGTLQTNGGKGEMGVSLDGTKVSGLDYDAWYVQRWSGHELAMTLLYNLKLRLAGNRVPMTFCIHSNYYDNNPDRLAGLKEFIDSALTYPDVRFVTGNQLIDWMENPVGLDGTGDRDTCKTFTVPYCDCGEEPYDTTICGIENIRAYEDSIANIDCETACIPITSIKRTNILQNKGFMAFVVGKSLNIAFENGKFADISVFDTRGRMILRQSNVKNNTNIPFVNKSGIYFVKAFVGNNVITQKIVIK